MQWRVCRELHVVQARRGRGVVDKYLVLEWTFACLLSEVYGVPLFPIFIGAKADGTADPASDLLKAGDVVGGMPAITVDSVVDRLTAFYKRHAMEVPALLEKLTVAEVVSRIRRKGVPKRMGLRRAEAQHL